MRERWVGVAVALCVTWLACLASGCSDGRFTHGDGVLRVREGWFHEHVLPYGDSVEVVVRTVAFERVEVASAEYVDACLTGIPLAAMPVDRPFTDEDLRRAVHVCFVVPDPAVRRRMEAILAGPNLGWRKIRYEGRELVPEDAGREGFAPLLVELKEISVNYGPVADVPARWRGGGNGSAGEVQEGTPPLSGASPGVLPAVEMVEVAGGTFLAWERPEVPVAPPTVVIRDPDGSVREVVEEDDDLPEPQRITVADFAIGAREVTRELWSRVMGAPAPGGGGPEYPITGVTYRQVEAFLRRLNAATGEHYRLPTEYEWEYAARGGGRRRTWSGTSDPKLLLDYAWLGGNSGCRPQPVGRLRPNDLGLYDMTGNVWEYCLDLSEPQGWETLPEQMKTKLRRIPGVESAYGRPFHPVRDTGVSDLHFWHLRGGAGSPVGCVVTHQAMGSPPMRAVPNT